MRDISSIENPSVIRAILEHRGLWLARSKPPLKIHDPPIRECAAYEISSQTHADDFHCDPDSLGNHHRNFEFKVTAK